MGGIDSFDSEQLIASPVIIVFWKILTLHVKPDKNTFCYKLVWADEETLLLVWADGGPSYPPSSDLRPSYPPSSGPAFLRAKVHGTNMAVPLKAF